MTERLYPQTETDDNVVELERTPGGAAVSQANGAAVAGAAEQGAAPVPARTNASLSLDSLPLFRAALSSPTTLLDTTETKSHRAYTTHEAVSNKEVAEAVWRAGWEGEAAAIAECGNAVYHHSCKECGHEWESAFRCHHRLCPVCAARRSRLLYSEYSKLAQVASLKHLVLTIRSEAGLGLVLRRNGKVMDSFTWIRWCFEALRRRKLFKQAWRGGLYSLEVTYDASKGWHVHIHALVVGAYVPQEQIAKAWLSLTGNSSVVWISMARRPHEALKYVLKPSRELLADSAALDDLLTVMKGKRFVGTWGVVWGQGWSEKKLTGHEKVSCPVCGSTHIFTISPAMASMMGANSS